MIQSDESSEAELRRSRHRSRDRIFGLVFVVMVGLGLVSLYYSPNWVTGLIIIGLVLVVVGVGWITGTLTSRAPDGR